ncbi:MAG: polysaccharide deacetylase family protein [Pseudomonadota bacterium]
MPDSFGRRFALFVDTEEDFDWSLPFTRTEHSTRSAAAMAVFQARMETAGVKPVYLVDYAIASAPEAAGLLRGFQDAGTCTIGAHLHPWINPPHDEALSGPNSFAGNLPPELEKAKLVELSRKIDDVFGRRPTVFRAGRYGVGARTAQTLVELGYTIDTSIRARFDYSAQQGPDFTRYRPLPYRLMEGALLEIPLTALFLGPIRAPARVQRLLSRVGLAKRVALTPEGTSLADAKRAIDVLLEQDHRLFSLSFHSPSLAPGNTPFVRSAEDLAGFYAWWDAILDHFAKRGVAPASVEEIAEAARA